MESRARRVRPTHNDHPFAACVCVRWLRHVFNAPQEATGKPWRFAGTRDTLDEGGCLGDTVTLVARGRVQVSNEWMGMAEAVNDVADTMRGLFGFATAAFTLVYGFHGIWCSLLWPNLWNLVALGEVTWYPNTCGMSGVHWRVRKLRRRTRRVAASGPDAGSRPLRAHCAALSHLFGHVRCGDIGPQNAINLAPLPMKAILKGTKTI